MFSAFFCALASDLFVGFPIIVGAAAVFLPKAENIDSGTRLWEVAGLQFYPNADDTSYQTLMALNGIAYARYSNSTEVEY